MTVTVVKNHRPYKGLNFFNSNDQKVFQAIASGEVTISGFHNKHLREEIHDKNTSQISISLKRLSTHGLIKRVAKTYKYYLARFGSNVITMGLKLKELHITPELASLA